jgi:pilus assembly protein FimV
MRATVSALAFGAALWLTAGSAQAMGFGRVVNATQLGQALNFSASVRLETDETLPRECVSAEVFSGDNKVQPSQVRVTLEGAAESSERTVRISTASLIDEPVVTVNVTIGCTAKVTRRFVAFIDPPVLNLAQAGATDAPAAPQRAESALSPLIASVQGTERRRPVRQSAERSAQDPSARRRARAAAVSPTVASATPVAPAAPRKVVVAPRTATVARAPASAGGARLELETSPMVTARAVPAPALAPAAAPVVPPQAITSANVMPPAQTASVAQAEQQSLLAERERQRITELEQGLAKLRADGLATQQALAGLQARLREAQAERYANPLVYGLAWLSALLALAVAALWWRQSRASASAQWWAAPPPGAAESRLPAAAAAPSVAAPLHSRSNVADGFGLSGVADDLAPGITEPAPSPRTVPMPLAPIEAAAAPVVPESSRELSVEELIDLEQQAEFFVVLGQDEAAIELLMSHVRRDGGISPLPYLKLLEIYRRRGDTVAYQRTRERFNQRFNAYAPDWESDLQQGRSLVDYPEIIARLQALWVTPPRAMETLDASLFRRNTSDDTFDLPAYRELLFLYSVARDLAEQDAAGPQSQVDLLLPLADEAAAEPISRLMAATNHGDFQNSDMMTMPLDLDVSFDPTASRTAYMEQVETTPAALLRTGDRPFGRDSRFLDFDVDEASPPAPEPPKAPAPRR